MSLWADLNKSQKIFAIGMFLGVIMGAVLTLLEDEDG
jgi:hypothetical protein